jgi:hypothetical protein
LSHSAPPKRDWKVTRYCSGSSFKASPSNRPVF